MRVSSCIGGKRINTKDDETGIHRQDKFRRTIRTNNRRKNDGRKKMTNNTVCAVCGREYDDWHGDEHDCSGATPDSDWRWLCEEDELPYLQRQKFANGDKKKGEWILLSHVGREWTQSRFNERGELITIKYVKYEWDGDKIKIREPKEKEK